MKKKYLIVLFLFSLTIQAKDYYVNPSTGDDTNNGSMESPWESVNHAFSVLQPGDVLNLYEGIYQPMDNIPGGEPGKPITIKSVDGQRAVIDAEGVDNGILMTNDHIIIDGLEIGSPKKSGINIRSNYVTIRNCIIHDSGAAVKANTRDTINHHLLVENCSFYNFSGIPVFHDAAEKVIIRNNIIYNCGSVAMDPGGVQELLIENNFVYNPRQKLGGLKIRWGNVEDVTGPNCNGAVVRNNIFLEGDKYNVLLASANGAVVYNNTMINNMLNGALERAVMYMQRDPADINEGKPDGPNRRNVLKNNILQINGGDSDDFNHNVLVEIRKDMTEDIITHEFDNNLYYKSSGSDYILLEPTFIKKNEVKGWGNQFDMHSIVGEDPKLKVKDTFESPEDFMPVEDSPVIDKGTYLTVTVGSGNSNIIKVKDSRYFYGGHGMIDGDKITIGDNTATVIDRDINANTITLDKSIVWKEGEPVSLPYSGTSPDIGAYEKGQKKEIGNSAGAKELFQLINKEVKIDN